VQRFLPTYLGCEGLCKCATVGTLSFSTETLIHEVPLNPPHVSHKSRTTTFSVKKTNRIVSVCLQVNAFLATMISDHACTVPWACHKLIMSGNAGNRLSCFCSHYHHVFHDWVLVRVDYSCPKLVVERAYRSWLFNHQCAIVLEQLLQASWYLTGLIWNPKKLARSWLSLVLSVNHQHCYDGILWN
jgi:hypothetical protein